MAHPSEQMPKNTYLISATTTDVNATPKNADHFNAITCSVAGTVKVRGGGVYEYVDVSDASDVFQNYIDPNTGAPFATNGKMTPDGFYQKIDSLDTDIAMIAGQTVYGRFASVKSDGTFTGFAYAG